MMKLSSDWRHMALDACDNNNDKHESLSEISLKSLRQNFCERSYNKTRIKLKASSNAHGNLKVMRWNHGNKLFHDAENVLVDETKPYCTSSDTWSR